MESVAHGVHRAVEEARLRSPVVVGRSFAAIIATVYAAPYPTRGIINADQPLQVARVALGLDLIRKLVLLRLNPRSACQAQAQCRMRYIDPQPEPESEPELDDLRAARRRRASVGSREYSAVTLRDAQRRSDRSADTANHPGGSDQLTRPSGRPWSICQGHQQPGHRATELICSADAVARATRVLAPRCSTSKPDDCCPGRPSPFHGSGPR
jgi:pimeloyl-ACP methyl ester carboxylesterase